jgi:catechol 2,3-dioxygenase-like lactoylglutathione lyase family enzyme
MGGIMRQLREMHPPGGVTMTTPAVAFSHVGLRVTDLAHMEDFYTRVVGLLVTDRGTLRDDGPTLVFLSRNPDEHHQLVLATGRPPGMRAAQAARMATAG